MTGLRTETAPRVVGLSEGTLPARAKSAPMSFATHMRQSSDMPPKAYIWRAPDREPVSEATDVEDIVILCAMYQRLIRNS